MDGNSLTLQQGLIHRGLLNDYFRAHDLNDQEKL